MTPAPAPRPTLADWMAPPANRWAFQHVRELIPTARVRRAGRPLPLPPAAPGRDLLALDVGVGDGPLATYLDGSRADALVVLRDGRLVAEWYADGVDADTPHILMSVTKSVTALLAGTLAGKGLVDLDAPVVDLVPEAAGSTYGDARIRHLLDMTVATGWDEDYVAEGPFRTYRRASGWTPGGEDGPGLRRAALAVPPDGAGHGTRFHYVSPNADVLGWVLERAAGEPYAEALSRHLWGPLGAEADAEITLDRLGGARTTGGLCVVPRDLARLGQLVLEGGRGVVPAAFVADLRAGGPAATWAAGEWAESLPGWTYRSLWYRPVPDEDVVCAIGIHGQLLLVDAGRGVVVALNASWPVPSDEAAEADEYAVARAIAAAVGA